MTEVLEPPFDSSDFTLAHAAALAANLHVVSREVMPPNTSDPSMIKMEIAARHAPPELMLRTTVVVQGNLVDVTENTLSQGPGGRAVGQSEGWRENRPSSQPVGERVTVPMGEEGVQVVGWEFAQHLYYLCLGWGGRIDYEPRYLHG